jgi:hypothetical protein
VCSRASSSSGSSSSPQQPQGGGFLSFFDRLPPRVQLGVMGALLFVGMVSTTAQAAANGHMLFCLVQAAGIASLAARLAEWRRLLQHARC